MLRLLWYFLICLPLLASAQNDYYPSQPVPVPNRPITLVLKDGTQLRGKFISQDSAGVVVETRNLGQVRVPTSQITRFDQLVRPRDNATYPNLFSQTMRLVPTAFSAEKGRAYFRNYLLYFSQFEYGINDNWSVGTTFFTFVPPLLFSLNTKVSFPVGNGLRLGVNAQYVALNARSILFNGRSGSYADIGYVQGIATIGDRANNLTFGLGGSLSNGDLARNFIGSFGLVRKVSPKLTLISENFVLVGGRTGEFATMLSGGVRFDRRRHAFDVALYLPVFFERNSRVLVTGSAFASYHLRIGK